MSAIGHHLASILPNINITVAETFAGAQPVIGNGRICDAVSIAIWSATNL